jgi:ribosome-binding factor A
MDVAEGIGHPDGINMSRRTDRVGNLIRNELGQILLAKMSDPRFDPIRTSITRVTVPEDLLSATVYLSVAGPESAEKKTVSALTHAAGYLQEQLMKRIQLRHTPKLDFRIDTKFKKTVETLNLIAEVSAELHAQDEPTGDSTGPAETDDIRNPNA